MFLRLSVQQVLAGLIPVLLLACSPGRHVRKDAAASVFAEPALKTAHIGISVFDPATGKYLFDHNAEKYFVPASNIKIPTCYAAMKYLGDSLVGLRYGGHTSYILPTGDPTFLHPDFAVQPVFDFLSQKDGVSINKVHLDAMWQEHALGSGWSWNDYDAQYMAERSPMPVMGNLVRIESVSDTTWFYEHGRSSLVVQPAILHKIYTGAGQWKKHFAFTREMANNRFITTGSTSIFKRQHLPFVTNGVETATLILNDTLGKNRDKPFIHTVIATGMNNGINVHYPYKIHSQPTDSLLKPMMHRSDNFFAEQALLMVSNELLGVMSDRLVTDTLLKTTLADLPQKPRWVDGSGLSRYNLFSPKDLVVVIGKMHKEFGAARLQHIFPTGNEGTLSNYYKTDSNYLWAKTGTLSGVVALSGFMKTKKGKLLYFSVLVNNHTGPATPVRRAVEKFIQAVREKN